MKPMGLIDPRTGRRPYAVVQLRQENLRADSYNLVGFQNHMRFAEQARVFRLIPGLEHAEFLRYGQIHRNTYINAPALLTPTLQLRDASATFSSPDRFRAWKATWNRSPRDWLPAGMPWSWQRAQTSGPSRARPPSDRCAPMSRAPMPRNYQPANITFDLLPTLDEPTRLRFRHDKRARHAEVCRRAHRQAGRISFRLCLNSPPTSSYFWMNCAARTRPRTPCETTRRIWISCWRTSRYPDRRKRPWKQIDALAIREWLGHLYEQRLTAVSMRRKLAAVRSFFKFLVARRASGEKRGAHGAHAESSQTAAVGDDRRTNQHPGGRCHARSRKIRTALSGARPGDFRAAVRLRAAHQRAGGLESGRFRFQRALDSRARQRQEGAAGSVRGQSVGVAGTLSHATGNPALAANKPCS